jgi:hypothetical protein
MADATYVARPEFAQAIEDKANWQVKQFLDGEEWDERPTLQVKNFIEGIISSDYHGRTLVELIQNAHDAHDRNDEDGCIEIVLDETDGDHGALYVANRGNPLSKKNFAAIVDVALSDKPPSEGIGNKGVGFKSVLHLSRCPEVYSRSLKDAPAFDGFTFRFGRPEDFAVLAARQAPHVAGLADRLEENVSTLTVTVPLKEVPKRVAELGHQGVSTVIRLPFHSSQARQEAIEQVELVASSVVPIHLFLDRIASIVLTVVTVDGSRTRTLTRSVSSVDTERGLTRVQLQDQTQYLVARRTVAERAVLDAIATTRETGAHLPGWERWVGNAEVAIALSAGAALQDPRLYNFLPMGTEVSCPVAAHLQAPFFSSLDRRSLDTTYPINELFLNEAAKLAASLLVAAADGLVDLPAGTLVDLGCWTGAHLSRLRAAIREHERELAHVPFVATVAGDNHRAPVDKATLWESNGTWFTPARLQIEQQATLIDPHLGPVRLRRLEDLYAALERTSTWSPRHKMLVAFAEQCADAMFAANVDPEAWATFYDELSAELGPGPLAGATIVVGQDRLLPANSSDSATTVFFPAQRAQGYSPSQPPDAVRELLAFVRDDIPWRLDDQSYRPGRRWLEDHVAEYGSEEILRVVSAAMVDRSRTDAELQDCLIYAFRIWRSARTLSEDAFPSVPFRVPVEGGWMPADEAHFGPGWGGDRQWVDSNLAKLADEGAVADFQVIRSRLLRPPTSWLPEDTFADPMRTFLEQAGVRHGLWPWSVEARNTSLTGGQINKPSTVPHSALPAELPEAARKTWVEAAQQWTGTRANYGSVPYVLERLTRLPGQFEWSALSERSRQLYGELIVAGLDEWDEEDLFAPFYRRASYDRARWPSLVTAFLLQTAWLPQTRPGDRAQVDLVLPGQAWWVTDDIPNYLPGPAVHLRRTVGARAVSRLIRLGVRHWDGAESAATRIDYLVSVIGEARTWVPGTRAEYERSWQAFLAGNHGSQPSAVLVERLSVVEATDGTETGETVYYADPGVPQSALLAQLPIPRLGFNDRSLAKRVGQFWEERAPERFRSVAEAAIRVDWPQPREEGALLSLLGDWLESVVLLVLAQQQGFGATGARQQERAARILREARVALVDSFATFVDNHEVGDASQQLSCWDQRAEHGVVVVKNLAGANRIKLAERASEGIAQALHQPGMANDLRVALIDLHELVPAGRPTTDDIARVLRLSPSEVLLVSDERAGWHPDLSALVDVLATVAPEAAEELRSADVQHEGREDTRTWMAERLGADLEYVDRLLDYAARSWRSGPVEDGLVSLPAANRGLRLLGLNPLTNADGQSSQWRQFLAAHRSDIVDELRDRFIPRVNRDAAELDTYASLAESIDIDVSPTWVSEHWTVPSPAQRARVEEWLAKVGGPPLPSPSGLPPVSSLREAQKARLTTTFTTARDVIMTWAGANDIDVPQLIDVATVSAHVRDSGYLDFGERQPPELLAWLRDHDLWPTEMPLTLSHKELGITADALREARERKRREHEEARRRESTLTYKDTTYSAEADDLLRLAQDLADSFTDDQLGKPPAFEELALAPPPITRTPRRSAQQGGRRASAPPQDKTQLVGLAGEVLAGQWLQARFGLPVEQTWCSGYRQDVLGDGKGSDSLGYDYMVTTEDVTYLVEVKATTTSETGFRLTETEVHRALNLADEEVYVVLFISDVLDEIKRQYRWLPNPLGPGASFYTVEGREIRFRFTVA